ncbi:MAG: barstar family protein [Lachnospiraceae bacterium]|nr:barstar family protein [Lachnospiraceae bacterium]
MTDRETAHEYIAKVLGFPEYYGKNLDALFDCLTDMKSCEIKMENKEGLKKLGEYNAALLAVFKEAALANGKINFS